MLCAEADRGRGEDQRGARHISGRDGVIEPGGREVVGRVGVKHRREVLRLATSRPELVLPAAVDTDAAGGAVVIGVKQRAQRFRTATA